MGNSTSGFTKVPNDLIDLGPKISANAFRLMVVILRFNPSYPSYYKLMELTGASRATVARGLAELERKNILLRVSGRTGMNNQYKYLGVDLVQVSELNCSRSSKSKLRLVSGLNSNKTNSNKTNKPTVSEFNFETLYEIFPKRLGENNAKSRGIKKCRSKIKTKKAYQQLSEAVKNYSSFVASKRAADPRWNFGYKWPNFISQHWEDWVEPTQENANRREVSLEEL